MLSGASAAPTVRWNNYISTTSTCQEGGIGAWRLSWIGPLVHGLTHLPYMGDTLYKKQPGLSSRLEVEHNQLHGKAFSIVSRQ
jgi:hypothetical protein